MSTQSNFIQTNPDPAGQQATIVLSFSDSSKQGSLEKAKEILIDEYIRKLDYDGVFSSN